MKEVEAALRKVWIPGSMPRGMTLRSIADATSELDLANLAFDYYPQWLAGYLQHKVATTHADGSDITGFRIVREGGFTGYDDTPVLRPSKGWRFQIERLVDGCRMSHNDKLVGAYVDLPLIPRPSRVPLQFSVPHYVDASIFTLSGKLSFYRLHHKLFGAFLAIKNLTRFRAAMLMEITEAVHEVQKRDLKVTEDALWSVEAPSVLYGLHMTPRWLRRPVRSWMVYHMAEMLGDIPQDRAVLHLCAARFNRTAIVHPRTLAVLVDFLNQLGDELDRRELLWPPVSIPIALADRPAPQDEGFYAPLSRLDTRWRVIAGVVDSRHPDASRDGLRATERALGRLAWGVSTTCGWADFNTEEIEQTISLLGEMQNLPEVSRSI